MCSFLDLVLLSLLLFLPLWHTHGDITIKSSLKVYNSRKTQLDKIKQLHILYAYTQPYLFKVIFHNESKIFLISVNAF